MTYSFVTNGAESIAPITSDFAIELPTPAIDGYVFMGWYVDPEFSGEGLKGKYYSSKDNTLYARFMEEDEYIETYLRGQSMEYAYAAESGRTYDVDIREKGAQNYFAVNVKAGEKWNITTPSGMGYHKIFIYDSNGNLILSYYDLGTSGSEYDIDFSYRFTKDGTYYIGVGYKDSKRIGSFTATLTKE